MNQLFNMVVFRFFNSFYFHTLWVIKVATVPWYPQWPGWLRILKRGSSGLHCTLAHDRYSLFPVIEKLAAKFRSQTSSGRHACLERDLIIWAQSTAKWAAPRTPWSSLSVRITGTQSWPSLLMSCLNTLLDNQELALPLEPSSCLGS